MAERPVFITNDAYPYYRSMNVSFTWNGGFAAVQKQKNIKAMHDTFQRLYPDRKVLEISSRSMQEHGSDLSAFSLMKRLPETELSVPVECVFQGGKVFENGGPYTDLYYVSPKEAKRDERLHTGAKVTGFMFGGESFPLQPVDLFYNFLYISALQENEHLKQVLLQYDAFTDVEFNPQKSLNCQAKAAAVYVSLMRLHLLEGPFDKERFINILRAE